MTMKYFRVQHFFLLVRRWLKMYFYWCYLISLQLELTFVICEQITSLSEFRMTGFFVLYFWYSGSEVMNSLVWSPVSNLNVWLVDSGCSLIINQWKCTILGLVSLLTISTLDQVFTCLYNWFDSITVLTLILYYIQSLY